MDKNIGPWPLGMDMLSPDTRLPRNQPEGRLIAAREAVDGIFDRAGTFASRPGLARVASLSGLHSLWTRPDGRTSYAVQGSTLVQVSLTGRSLGLTPLADLPSALALDFCDLNGETVYSSLDTLGVIGADGVRPLSVPDAAGLHAVPATVGGLYAGRYAVAMAWLNARGEEGGLSPITPVTLAEGQGVRVTIPPAPEGATTARVYRTGQNGDVLYRVADAPPGMAFTLGAAPRGRAADTAYLRAMRPGAMVRAWRGRLLTARGTVLTLSEPMRYGLTSPRHGFVAFPGRITFIEPVEGGVFVGQTDTVLFLDGAKPGDWQLRRTGGARPVPGSSTTVSADLFDPQLQLQGGDHALWLAANGYVLGRPTGQLVEPQAQRIRLPDAAAGRTAVYDRRLLTLTA